MGYFSTWWNSSDRAEKDGVVVVFFKLLNWWSRSVEKNKNCGKPPEPILFHKPVHNIFCKAAGINQLCRQSFTLRISSSLVFPRQLTSIFPVISACVNCLSAFPQASVYFLPHFAVGTPSIPAENKRPPPRLFKVPLHHCIPLWSQFCQVMMIT